MKNSYNRPKVVSIGLRKSIFYLIVLVVVFYSPALKIVINEAKLIYPNILESINKRKNGKLIDNDKWPFKRNLKFANGAVNLEIQLKPLNEHRLGYILEMDPAYPTKASANGLIFYFNLRDKDGFLLGKAKVMEHQMVNQVNENGIRMGASIEDEVYMDVKSAIKIASIDYTYGGDTQRIKAFEQLADATPVQIAMLLEKERKEVEQLAEERRLAEIEKRKEEERIRLAEAEEFRRQEEERKKRELADKIRIAEEERLTLLESKKLRRNLEEERQKKINEKENQKLELKRKWSQITIGLSMYEVKTILGQPNDISSTGSVNLGFGIRTDSRATYFYTIDGFIGHVKFVNGSVSGYGKPYGF